VPSPVSDEAGCEDHSHAEHKAQLAVLEVELLKLREHQSATLSLLLVLDRRAEEEDASDAEHHQEIGGDDVLEEVEHVGSVFLMNTVEVELIQLEMSIANLVLTELVGMFSDVDQESFFLG